MKIKIDIDCSPQEARAFFGLPDLEPMQGAVLDRMQARLTEYLEAKDPEALLRLWLPGGIQGLGHEDLGTTPSSVHVVALDCGHSRIRCQFGRLRVSFGVVSSIAARRLGRPHHVA